MTGPTARQRYVAASNERDFAAAEQAAEDWLADLPDDPLAPVVLAECRMRRQAFEEALVLLRPAVARDAGDIRAARAMATVLYRLQDYRGAQPHAERALAARPDDAGMQTTVARIGELLARENLFASRPYIEAYQAHMDDLVRQDPKAAIGGMWDDVGQLQIDFLKSEGVRPDHRLLDLGCGTLRAGRHLIRYLDTGHYCGIDMSAEAIRAAETLVADEGLATKEPLLLRNPAGDLRLNELAGARFDIVLAQSVFTHLLEPHIAECFAHIGKALAPGGRFYFTYVEAEAFTQRTVKDFSYPLGFFQGLGAGHGLTVTGRDTYNHPRDQRMALAMVREDPE